MVRISFAVFLAGALGFLPAPVSAATREVTVGDNFFSPSDLTIDVGDTVRWTYSGSRQHDVTADDLSWNSVTSNNFTYERTFETVGEILYHCTVHSRPGRDINVAMNGRINVVGEETVAINIGMMDAWYNPQTNGQGFLINVFDQSKIIFLAWFTFDTERPPEDAVAIFGEAGHRWITASGPYDGDTATLDVFLSTGGILDAPEPPIFTDPVPYGSIVIKWTGCNSAILSYDIPSLGLMDDIEIERAFPENVPICEAGQMMME